MNCSINWRPTTGPEVATNDLAALPMDSERLSGVIEARLERGQPLVAHEHQKVDLRQMGRMGRIEAARTVLDGVGPVEWKRLTRLQVDAIEGLGRQPLDRVAVNASDRDCRLGDADS